MARQITMEHKTRVQVPLTDDTIRKIDIYASKMGMSRAAVMAYAIGQYVMGLDKVIESMERVPEIVSGQVTIDEILKGFGQEQKNAPQSR